MHKAEFILTKLSSSIAQINEAQVLKMSAARDLVLMLYTYKDIGQQHLSEKTNICTISTIDHLSVSFSIIMHRDIT